MSKVDVEGAEAAVLQGVEPGHWPAIRQVVVEVNDIDGAAEDSADTNGYGCKARGRLARVVGLLRDVGGFDRVIVDHDAWQGMAAARGSAMVYATRAT